MGHAAKLDAMVQRKHRAEEERKRKLTAQARRNEENEQRTVYGDRGNQQDAGNEARPAHNGSWATDGGVRLAERLGAGTFGVTWRAWDHEGSCRGEEVAVKIYRPEVWTRETADGRVELSDPGYQGRYREWLEKFVDEAEHLKRLKHRGIVRIERYGRGFGSAFIVMEYIAGGTMRKAMRQAPQGFDFPVVRNAMMQLCMALGAVHDAGMIHRDVKPGNIMIRNEKELVLIDFGAARPLVQEGMTAMHTHGYAPIEQYDSQAPQGPWTDLYAVAAVGHELLLGEAPRPAPGRSMSPQLAKLERLAARIGASRTIDAIKAGLATKPEQRPQTCSEMIRLLNGWGQTNQSKRQQGGTLATEAKVKAPSNRRERRGGQREPAQKRPEAAHGGTEGSTLLRAANRRDGFVVHDTEMEYLFEALQIDHKRKIQLGQTYKTSDALRKALREDVVSRLRRGCKELGYTVEETEHRVRTLKMNWLQAPGQLNQLRKEWREREIERERAGIVTPAARR